MKQILINYLPSIALFLSLILKGLGVVLAILGIKCMLKYLRDDKNK